MKSHSWTLTSFVTTPVGFQPPRHSRPPAFAESLSSVEKGPALHLCNQTHPGSVGSEVGRVGCDGKLHQDKSCYCKH